MQCLRANMLNRTKRIKNKYKYSQQRTLRGPPKQFEIVNVRDSGKYQKLNFLGSDAG